MTSALEKDRILAPPVLETTGPRQERYSQGRIAKKLRPPLEGILDAYASLATEYSKILQKRIELGLSVLQAYQYLQGFLEADRQPDPARKHQRFSQIFHELRQHAEQEAAARDKEACQGVPPEERHALNQAFGDAYFQGGP